MTSQFRAMQLERAGQLLKPVMHEIRPVRSGEVRITVLACAVCRTDLHVIDGELTDPVLPIVPGHEIIGRIEELGHGVEMFKPGDRVGVPWLGWTCGVCEFCTTGRENLCPQARFTGYQIDGGFAAATYADARYVFPIPARFGDAEAAPLLCAGLIGWRALKAAGRGPRLGLYGFGAAAHIAVQVARFHGQEVFAFVRPGDEKAREFALRMGAVWAGPSDHPAPEPLDAAIIFAPDGELVPVALATIKPGGVVVCGGIHMSNIPSFPYSILWQERVLRSIANLTRADAVELLALSEKIPVRTETIRYSLTDANRAVADLRTGALSGAAVLIPDSSTFHPKARYTSSMTPGIKTVLITGAAKRLGRAIALHLGETGWSVAVHYNSSQAEAEDTVAALHGMGVHAAALDANLESEEDTQRLISRANAAVGPLTALVNNASVFESDVVSTVTRMSWDRHMETNLRAPLVLSQNFAEQLPSHAEGAIVNLLDQRLFKPTPQFLSYGVSRAGLHWLTGVLAQALAPRIRVNAVAPGPTLRNARQSENHFRRQQASTILGHGATPDDVTSAVMYLLEAHAVTGQTITVDGGQHLIWQTPDTTGVIE